jgi:hypothetical protein
VYTHSRTPAPAQHLGQGRARRARCRDAPPEDCGGIWVFNEQFAEFGDLFTVAELNERLATVLIPGSA